jgi:nicotinamidase-related amidase
MIYADFFTKVKTEASRPNAGNIFYKGKNRTQEQYSSFNSTNSKGETLGSYISEYHKSNKDSIVIMSGIATEFCIKESSLDLLGSGNNVNIIVQDLAYVNFNGHLESLKILKGKGAILI